MTFGGMIPCTIIDYPGKTACMVFTIGCNFRCPYCHNPELVDETIEETISDTSVLAFLKKRRGMLDGIVVTGGEPTMHGDSLLSFLRHVKRLGFLVKIDTNGTNPSLLKKALKEKLVDYIAMDIKAPLRTYHRVAGRPVNTGAVKESIALMMKGEVLYEFRTTVVKALLSPNDIEKIAKEIAGAERYYLQKFVPTKILNPQFKRKVSYTDEEFEMLRSRAAAHVGYCGVR